MAKNIVGPLKLISNGKRIVLPKTDGTEMLGKASDLFSYIDREFQRYGCNVEGKPTAKMPVQVYQMIKDGTFQQIFGAFRENLDRLCLSQSQIKDFVRNYRHMLALRWYTFFLFKVGDNFFVASVGPDGDGGLAVHFDFFSKDDVWLGDDGGRMVLPQL